MNDFFGKSFIKYGKEHHWYVRNWISIWITILLCQTIFMVSLYIETNKGYHVWVWERVLRQKQSERNRSWSSLSLCFCGPSWARTSDPLIMSILFSNYYPILKSQDIRGISNINSNLWFYTIIINYSFYVKFYID